MDRPPRRYCLRPPTPHHPHLPSLNLSCPIPTFLLRLRPLRPSSLHLQTPLLLRVPRAFPKPPPPPPLVVPHHHPRRPIPHQSAQPWLLGPSPPQTRGHRPRRVGGR